MFLKYVWPFFNIMHDFNRHLEEIGYSFKRDFFFVLDEAYFFSIWVFSFTNIHYHIEIWTSVMKELSWIRSTTTFYSALIYNFPENVMP